MTSVEYLAMRPNLPVRDVAASVAFYRDVVGLELEHAFDDGSFAILRRGGAELALVHADSPQPQGAYLNVTGVKTLHARCAERGVPIVAPLNMEPWGLLDFVIEDPDGHRIAIGERQHVAGQESREEAAQAAAEFREALDSRLPTDSTAMIREDRDFGHRDDSSKW